ncbi:hypothetical protein AQJ43_36445 [Streptomyces avermitilis]|uniref:Uncharacterized protein n=3 Tax=Streptomyces TaxID=1883 RepID=Q82YC7_STRAW|nr:hypothetical protein [Streptomyces avermitilis]KUN48778.1 hypothetical protein AQJ43_36445 [Streptomyces avermitilis]OOV24670.1 hypothetical protein SM007_27605 [Streptomyces avermitilis]BAC75338.1 hypothetical protein SAVERM_1p54 [Streptomyces avermitilis MA-4680 = NBRC 14893]BBJ56394.1 hypothetical protein SAVMC3_90230 [Streptomyces avermitilis]GDY70427.1 hypothetical protein SAV14893_098200 [Streptomyces avermitilis]
MTLQTNEFWVGTYHGRHDGRLVKVTATRDDTRLEPYAWTCTCGASQTFPTEDGVDRTAWRHTHPTLWDRLRQKAALLLRTR